MSVNIAAGLLGLVIIAILAGFSAWQKKQQEQFRRELIEEYLQEDEK